MEWISKAIIIISLIIFIIGFLSCFLWMYWYVNSDLIARKIEIYKVRQNWKLEKNNDFNDE